MSVLGIWGLDDVAETTYRAMLRNPDFSRAELARHLDLDLATVQAAVGALDRVGLVATGSRDRGSAASPATTLAPRVHAELADLEERRARLDAVRASLSGYAADHMVGQARGWAGVPLELLGLEQSFAAVEDLQRGTTGEVLSCHPVVDFDVDAPSYVELLEHQLAGGRPMRGLYPADVADDSARLRYVRHWAEAGEEVRLATHPLPSIAVFGQDAALVVSDRSGDNPGALIVRAPALIGLVRELFEAYWSRATPMAARDTARSGDADQLLALLRLGLKDESIARQLGVSLRTVRRRVALLMADLDATTRFQAGLEAGRRGMV